MKKLNYNFVITIVAVVAILCGSHQIANGYCYDKDFRALKTLYESTNGDDWINNAGWDVVRNNDSPPAKCDFENLKGVTVWAGRVIRLQLGRNNLVGQIPSSIYFLDKLQILDLSTNSLSGRIPLKIGYCLSLVNINLKDNNLVGQIPTSFSFIKSLSHLSLSNNNLTGRIPWQITNSTNLIRIELAANELSGDIPKEIGRLQKMSTFDVSRNQLSGIIPIELGDCENLRYCLLNDNELVGSIPSEITNIENLRKFVVRNNDLEGCYPNSLKKISTSLDSFSNTDYAISDGNNFYASWEKFDQFYSGACDTKIGMDNYEFIRVYPNPSAGLINVSIAQNDVSFDTPTHVEIFNTVGSKVYSNTSDGQIMKDIKLNVSYLPSGNYLLMLRNEEKIHYKKFIIK